MTVELEEEDDGVGAPPGLAHIEPPDYSPESEGEELLAEPPGIAEEIPGELGGEGGSDGEEVEPWLDGDSAGLRDHGGRWQIARGLRLRSEVSFTSAHQPHNTPGCHESVPPLS